MHRDAYRIGLSDEMHILTKKPQPTPMEANSGHNSDKCKFDNENAITQMLFLLENMNALFES